MNDRANHFSQNLGQTDKGNTQQNREDTQSTYQDNVLQSKAIETPSISLPKGGGAISGIGEKFEVNAVTGTGNLSVPVLISPGRNGSQPQLALTYNSGSGNSPFGLGWNIALPSISRKTQKGIPRYRDEEEDVFLLAGAEDLVPVLEEISDGSWQRRIIRDTDYADGYTIYPYRPRIEGLFARIERWVRDADGDVHWRVITGDNSTSIYGLSTAARIHHPTDRSKVFSWLIERTYDDKGNIIEYEYKAEDEANISDLLPQEKNRLERRSAFAQKYLKRVLYGNTQPYLIHDTDFDEENWIRQNNWHFYLVLDYGDQDEENPLIENAAGWPLRQDPFSFYRPGFEIRTYRLCRRILMFHYFPDELSPEPYWVGSTILQHDQNPIATQLNAVIHQRHEQGQTPASMPPISFRYTAAQIDEQIYPLSPDQAYPAPVGGTTTWLDLKGEGLSGLLSQYDQNWWYQSNLGSGRLGQPELVGSMPNLIAVEDPNIQLTDLDGNGQIELVSLGTGHEGYFALNKRLEWEPFVPFQDFPNINLNDPNIRRIDLTGDGHPDLIITEDYCLLWHASQATKGYAHAERVHQFLEEEQGPKIVFAEATQSIFLADMSGDGLTDIVRIRNGEICYWPNMGYGTFGTKVLMDQTPNFGSDFDPSRIRLGDIDGSGTTDVLYLTASSCMYWQNCSGNGWSEAIEIPHLPKVDSLSQIQLLDLLGNGTSCLVWTSPLPVDQGHSVRYIPLMSQLKPYLLTEVDNHMGGLTRLQYASSTQFYLEDKLAGRPWISRLPFPVQVLVRVETIDQITGTTFVNRYAYHHGYFDGHEREFRGFGMVEQWDTEDFESFGEQRAFEIEASNWSEDSHQPPVYTKSWFHTGFFLDESHISRYYESEYYQADTQAWTLPDTVLPAGLSGKEARQACRALKGRPLRVETYALDGTDQEIHPYTVAETNYHLRVEQPKLDQHYAVFFVCNCESLNYHYERNPEDPRIQHAHTIEIDPQYGMPLKTVSIVYPRRSDIGLEEQRRMYMTYDEQQLIHLDTDLQTYRTGLPFEQRKYEFHGFRTEGKWEKSELISLIDEASFVPYSTLPDGSLQMRLLARSRIRYLSNDLDSLLPWGQAASLGINYESYQLIFSPDILALPELEGRFTHELLLQGGYRNDIDPDQPALWWVPSGYPVFFPTEEAPWPTTWRPLENPAMRFYRPIGIEDPFGNRTYVQYDVHQLLSERIRDPLGNETFADLHDYRLLSSARMTDPNGNRSQVLFDTRGMVIATAIMGKADETDPAQMGDSLEDYTLLPTPIDDEGQALNQVEDILADPHAFLQGGSTFFYYDLFAWERERAPAVALGLAREVHLHMEGDRPTPVQISISYSGGMGQAVLQKMRIEPGEAFARTPGGSLERDAEGNPVIRPTYNRWLGSARTILNNKGNAVRQYEPYFSSTHRYEDEAEVREYGVSPTMFYDPIGRVIRTLMPDLSISRVSFTPWQVQTFDPNDTILESQWYRDRGAPDPAAPSPTEAEERAAWLAAQHANTPTIQHLDSLGRPFLSIVHNRWQYRNGDRGEGHYPTRTTLNIEGAPLAIFDARGADTLTAAQALTHYGNPVMQYSYAMGSLQLYSLSMDAGERWSLANVAGKPLINWDDREQIITYTYDEAQRPLTVHLTRSGGSDDPLDHTIMRTIYGESLPDAAERNLRGSAYQLYDASGLFTNERYDFKGNLLEASRQLAANMADEAIHWPAEVPDRLLEPEIFRLNTQYDAHNRMIRQENWHLTGRSPAIYEPQYNQRGLLVREDLTVNDERIRRAIANIAYDEKAQRTRIQYGNTLTTYTYDPLSFRLRHLHTATLDDALRQDLQYTYDAVGNITEIRDDAYEAVYFSNQEVEPRSQYVYDATYRLIEAYGRENVNLRGAPGPMEPEAESFPRPLGEQALRNYYQRYTYDAAGNISRMQHTAGAGAHADAWTRTNLYAEDNNRLQSSSIGNGNDPLIAINYTYNAHGSMLNYNQAPAIYRPRWDYREMIYQLNLGGGGHVFYQYDGEKQRTRKRIERLDGSIEERIYLGGMEWYRRRRGDRILEEIETHHLFADDQRVLIVEHVIRSFEDDLPTGLLYKYQYSNHLGSASLVLDEDGEIISYEEYHPYGTAAYQMRNQRIRTTQKRYRYTGMERDKESGLAYHTARYYLPWLGRWCSADPIGLKGGMNVYQYAYSKPTNYLDPSGAQSSAAEWRGRVLGRVISFIQRRSGSSESESVPPSVPGHTQPPIQAPNPSPPPPVPNSTPRPGYTPRFPGSRIPNGIPLPRSVPSPGAAPSTPSTIPTLRATSAAAAEAEVAAEEAIGRRFLFAILAFTLLTSGGCESQRPRCNWESVPDGFSGYEITSPEVLEEARAPGESPRRIYLPTPHQEASGDRPSREHAIETPNQGDQVPIHAEPLSEVPLEQEGNVTIRSSITDQRFIRVINRIGQLIQDLMSNPSVREYLDSLPSPSRMGQIIETLLNDQIESDPWLQGVNIEWTTHSGSEPIDWIVEIDGTEYGVDLTTRGQLRPHLRRPETDAIVIWR